MTSTITHVLSSTSLPRGAGPLTTVFTTPEFCSSDAWTAYDTPALASSICMPNGFTKYWDYKYGFYSPGICPESYTPGCTWPTSAATWSDGTPFIGGPLQDGETAIICCPTGYTCMGSPSTDEYVWSKCIKTTASTYTLITPTVSVYTTTPLVYAIQVRWKASDLNALETNPTKSGETITPTPTSAAAETSDQTAGATSTGSAASATGTASPSSPSSSDGGGSGLSTGARIGLGVGIGVAAAVLGILAYLVWRRRSRNGRELANTNAEGGKGGAAGKKGGFSELQDTQVGGGGGGGRESTSGGEATELASPEGATWNSSTWGGSTVISPLTPRPDPAGTATGGEATEMEVPETRHELSGHVTDFAEMPASNQFVAELPGDTPVQQREKWS